MNFRAALDELQKLGFVSPAQAEDAMQRLDSLEHGAPTAGQLARAAGLGAVAAPAVHVMGRLIAKGPKGVFEPGAGAAGIARDIASHAAKGAIGGGALPIVQQRVEERAEMNTLRKFLDQQRVADELAKSAKAKSAGGWDRFLGNAGGKVVGQLERAAAPAIQPRLARQAAFTPAAVGFGPVAAAAPKKLPLPSGPLNPSGGFH